ncbi:uncharacterized protein LOC144953775 [Lampetra fluviatilis]
MCIVCGPSEPPPPCGSVPSRERSVFGKLTTEPQPQEDEDCCPVEGDEAVVVVDEVEEDDDDEVVAAREMRRWWWDRRRASPPPQQLPEQQLPQQQLLQQQQLPQQQLLQQQQPQQPQQPLHVAPLWVGDFSSWSSSSSSSSSVAVDGEEVKEVKEVEAVEEAACHGSSVDKREEEEAVEEEVEEEEVEEVSVPQLCRLIESSLSAAKGPRLRCSHLLAPLGLLRRAALALAAASASEPCGLRGALVEISVSPAASSSSWRSSHQDDEEEDEEDDDEEDDDDEDGSCRSAKRRAAAVTWVMPRLGGPEPRPRRGPRREGAGEVASDDGDSGCFGGSGGSDGSVGGKTTAGRFGLFGGGSISGSISGISGSISGSSTDEPDQDTLEHPPAAVEATFRLTLELSEEGPGLAERGLAGLRSLLSPGGGAGAAAARRGTVRLAPALRVAKQRLYQRRQCHQQHREEED